MQEAQVRKMGPDPMGAFEQVLKDQTRLLLADGVFRVTEVYRPTNKVVMRFEGLAPREPAVRPDGYEESVLVRAAAVAFYLETGADFWSEAGMEA